jgi:prevent-host-death family protein
MRKTGYSRLKGTSGTANKKSPQANKAPQPKMGRASIGGSLGRPAVINDVPPTKPSAKPEARKTGAAQTIKQISATELKTSTSQAIQAALKTPIAIVKNGKPVAVLISNELFEQLKRLELASQKKPFPFDCAKDDPLINKNCNQDEYFRAMTDQEVDDFIEGRY